MLASIARPVEGLPVGKVVGEIRRFGAFGILYIVIGQAGVHELRIRVLDTGEELDYTIAEFLKDPED